MNELGIVAKSNRPVHCEREPKVWLAALHQCWPLQGLEHPEVRHTGASRKTPDALLNLSAGARKPDYKQNH